MNSAFRPQTKIIFPHRKEKASGLPNQMIVSAQAAFLDTHLTSKQRNSRNRVTATHHFSLKINGVPKDFCRVKIKFQPHSLKVQVRALSGRLHIKWTRVHTRLVHRRPVDRCHRLHLRVPASNTIKIKTHIPGVNHDLFRTDKSRECLITTATIRSLHSSLPKFSLPHSPRIINCRQITLRLLVQKLARVLSRCLQPPSTCNRIRHINLAGPPIRQIN